MNKGWKKIILNLTENIYIETKSRKRVKEKKIKDNNLILCNSSNLIYFYEKLNNLKIYNFLIIFS